MSENYYAEKLNSQNLFKAYDTQIPRVSQYLDAEINFVKKDLTGKENVLELGAGYGRILKKLASSCNSVLGVDISEESVELGKDYLKDFPNASMVAMDVNKINLDKKFDVILCLQNGLSAMKVNSRDFIGSLVGLLEEGGKVYFSTYSSNFWDYRLMWFKEQADKGLLGEIDYEKTRDGVIVCKDGFRAITHTEEDLRKIGEISGLTYEVEEVDGSSLFLIIHK